MGLDLRHPLFQAFREAFRAGRFFEAHEHMEEFWILHGRPSRSVLRGLVQLAVACEHYRRGKLAGARGVFERARSNLSGSPPGLAAGSSDPALDRTLETCLRRYERIIVRDLPEPLPPGPFDLWN